MGSRNRGVGHNLLGHNFALGRTEGWVLFYGFRSSARGWGKGWGWGAGGGRPHAVRCAAKNRPTAPSAPAP
ncbi:MAG: hypothetical protein C0441_02025 [Comamonadaceae bacterium]|nr:hypothetical protein [Comamonadaceae bacterium]